MSDGSWLRQASHAGALLAALGAIVWLSGLPFRFPSLGPTAYLFATRPSARESAPQRVVGGHAPACATTLIVGLGILSTPLQSGLILLAVGGLVVEQVLLARLG